jgi:hypothetical protein
MTMILIKREVVDDLVRIACESIDQLDTEIDHMNINCTEKAEDLNNRFESVLSSLGAQYVAFFSKLN